MERNNIKIKIKTVLLWAAIVVASVLLLTFAILYNYARTGGGDYRISLPGGYELVRTYANHVGLYRWTEVVAPPIDGYAIHGPIVVGHVCMPEPGESSVPGYFILDTRSGRVHKGLSKREWKDTLGNHGFPDEPRLKRPRLPGI